MERTGSRLAAALANGAAALVDGRLDDLVSQPPWRMSGDGPRGKPARVPGYSATKSVDTRPEARVKTEESAMSDETPDSATGGPPEERRSGPDRRQGGDRRQQDRGVWTIPVLRRLIDRRSGEDRRSGKDRRRS